MTIERAIEIMEEEHKRTNTEEVNEAYRFVINALRVAKELEEKEKYREDLKLLNDRWQITNRLIVEDSKNFNTEGYLEGPVGEIIKELK